jgi:isopenicillin-N N-acyltransferase-like protein
MAGHAFPLVEVAGSSYEMGYQHGAQAADLVSRHILWIEKQAGWSRDVLARNAMAFLPAVEALSPAFVEEVRGLADGAGISFGEAMLCQARTDAAHLVGGGCTAFALTRAATADQQPLAGQNQDLAPEYADVAILLRVNPTDGRPRALMFTFAGQLGYTGMNEYGLAHFNNSLFDYGRCPGLPRQPLKRIMLEQRTVGECVNLLAQHRVCSAANVVLCDGQGTIADVEVRPEGVAVFEGQGPDCIVHTNHYVSSEFASYETGSISDSRFRLGRMLELVEQNWGRITVETMKSILADHSGDPGGICRHGAGGWHSISGYVAEPSKGLLHVRRGHGCLGTWQTYPVR